MGKLSEHAPRKAAIETIKNARPGCMVGSSLLDCRRPQRGQASTPLGTGASEAIPSGVESIWIYLSR